MLKGTPEESFIWTESLQNSVFRANLLENLATGDMALESTEDIPNICLVL